MPIVRLGGNVRIQQLKAVDDPEAVKLKDCMDKYSGEAEMTNEMVRAFIDKVLIHEPDKIEIRWNFSEELMRVLQEDNKENYKI